MFSRQIFPGSEPARSQFGVMCVCLGRLVHKLHIYSKKALKACRVAVQRTLDFKCDFTKEKGNSTYKCAKESAIKNEVVTNNWFWFFSFVF